MVGFQEIILVPRNAGKAREQILQRGEAGIQSPKTPLESLESQSLVISSFLQLRNLRVLVESRRVSRLIGVDVPLEVASERM